MSRVSRVSNVARWLRDNSSSSSGSNRGSPSSIKPTQPPSRPNAERDALQELLGRDSMAFMRDLEEDASKAIEEASQRQQVKTEAEKAEPFDRQGSRTPRFDAVSLAPGDRTKRKIFSVVGPLTCVLLALAGLGVAVANVLSAHNRLQAADVRSQSRQQTQPENDVPTELQKTGEVSLQRLEMDREQQLYDTATSFYKAEAKRQGERVAALQKARADDLKHEAEAEAAAASAAAADGWLRQENHFNDGVSESGETESIDYLPEAGGETPESDPSATEAGEPSVDGVSAGMGEPSFDESVGNMGNPSFDEGSSENMGEPSFDEGSAGYGGEPSFDEASAGNGAPMLTE